MGTSWWLRPLVLALALVWVSLGCGLFDSGGSEESAGVTVGGRGPVGTLVFWGGDGAAPLLVDSRSGVLARGWRWPKYAFQLSSDGWGAAFTELGHLNIFRLFPDAVWDYGGDVGAWAHTSHFSPDDRSIVGVTQQDYQDKLSAVHYGRFNEDGSLVKQVEVEGRMSGDLVGSGKVVWSADSEHFVVMLSDGLALYNQGERVWFIPEVHASGLERTRTASFSPDGQWLAIAIYERPPASPNSLIHRGFQLYSVPDRTFVRYLGGVQDDKGGSIDVGEYWMGASNGVPDVPLWTYDSRGLVLQRGRLMVENSSNSCGNENPVPIQVLRIPESFLAGEPVIDDLSVQVPEERLGERCLRWQYLGAVPEDESLLFGFEYREKRYFGSAGPGVANGAYVIVELYFVEVPLDGSEAREIGYFNNDAPELGAPFGVAIYPFHDYPLSCRSGQTGDMLFKNGLVLDLESQTAVRVNQATQEGTVSGDCNCYAEAAEFTGVKWGIYDLRGNPVSTFDMEPALEVTTSFKPYDWR